MLLPSVHQQHAPSDSNDQWDVTVHVCMLTYQSELASLWPQINQPKGLDGLSEIRKAFEFTVEKMGADIASGPLWQEYIAFLEVRCSYMQG